MALDRKRFRKNTHMPSESRTCASLQRKRLFCMTGVQPLYKQFGKICICHIGYVAICQTGKIDICWSNNIAICQPCNTAICQNKLKLTNSIYFLQLKFSN